LQNLRKSLRAAARLAAVRRRTAVVLAALGAVVLVGAGGVLAGSSPTGLVTFRNPASVPRAQVAAGGKRIVVIHSSRNDRSPALRRMPAAPLRVGGEKEVSSNPGAASNHHDTSDAVVQSRLAKPKMPAPGLNFDGIAYPGVACSCAPPDPNGEVGATQYVQMVNQALEVFNKATGTPVLGPVDIATLWSGFGGVCQLNGDGDPIVLYDQLADRWLISQFAGASVPTDECIAVSQGGDATGAYYRYDFHLGSNFYDYPHLGVWPDGYYMSDNVFDPTGNSYLGPQPFAFDRQAMLTGAPATVITSTSPTIFNPNNDAIMPADLDGSIQPPAGAPSPFIELGFSSTWHVWRFHADFANPAASTFTLGGDLTPAGYTQLCSLGRSCVPQAGTTDGLDGIGDRPMFRPAYRRFQDGHEALVGDFTVQSGGVSGIRWFEIDNVTSGTPGFVQQSTYQPDNTWRWLGSAAMDAAGDLAIGFSASSAAINPQIRYAGRLSSDPTNQLAQGEATLYAGTGSQTGSGNRWGDYSDLTVDPSDQCTFWYTNEYYATTGPFNWRTRIGSFRFPNCTMRTLSVARAGTGTGTVTSNLTGIDCGTACSFQWWGGTTVGLSAAPTAGSAFAGWSGACSGKKGCSVTLSSDKSVTATFSRCRVPKLVGQKLRTAESKLTKAYCRVGRIAKKKTTKRRRGRVLRQSIRAGKLVNAYTKVKLTVGK
jgi:PASTA domain-containing protein/List-Bact-rpt repeat protein